MAGLLRRIFGGSGTARMLEVGSAAPDFSVEAHDGSRVSLRDLRGRKVVLWFYPKADTPGCTVEGKGFCSSWDKFAALGVMILGVSFDDRAANRAFAEKFTFPYPLLCDTDRRLGLAYGACDRSDVGHARRITYVIDENGIIRHALAKVDPATHTAEVMALVS
jgi:peroxiredoxin Q/BCP